MPKGDRRMVKYHHKKAMEALIDLQTHVRECYELTGHESPAYTEANVIALIQATDHLHGWMDTWTKQL